MLASFEFQAMHYWALGGLKLAGSYEMYQHILSLQIPLVSCPD